MAGWFWQKQAARSRSAVLGLALSIAGPLILSLTAKPLAAGSPTLDLPTRCILGEECWPMALFDHAPGPDVQDHRCAAVSYDGHDGTDIGVADLEGLARGIQVIAAAPGQVGGVRDGMADVDVSIAGPASVQGRECGNGVVIRHDDGWETQYCHMRQGSLIVRSGQKVERGDVLGLMGMSGLASYPHVHLTVRHLGKTVDPFAPDRAVVCPGQPHPGPGLWSPAAAAALQDASAAIVAAGVASQEPRWEDAKAGRLNARLLPARGKALIVWMEVQMVQPGDRLKIRIAGPDGRTVFQQSITVDQANRRLFRYFGRRTPNGGWPLGVYPIELTSIRARDGREFRKNLKAEMVNPE